MMYIIIWALAGLLFGNFILIGSLLKLKEVKLSDMVLLLALQLPMALLGPLLLLLVMLEPILRKTDETVLWKKKE